jgi:hypothetical protein
VLLGSGVGVEVSEGAEVGVLEGTAVGAGVQVSGSPAVTSRVEVETGPVTCPQAARVRTRAERIRRNFFIPGSLGKIRIFTYHVKTNQNP